MKLDEYLQRQQVGPRFVFITDLHARNRAPKMRKDNYRQALIEKLEWACTAAVVLNASSDIICGGDVFDVPKVNLDVADDLVDVFVRHRARLISVFGNHDLENSLASAPSVVLGHMMRRAKDHVIALPVLQSRPFALECPEYADQKFGPIHVWGHHYRYQNQIDQLEVRIADSDAPRVVVSHSMILAEEPGNWDPGTYALFEDVTSNAHLVLLGHYHPQQKMQRLNNPIATLIGGPGALMRGALSRDDLTRRPAIAVCEWNPERYEFEVEFIEVDCAAPAEEIFRLEEAQAEQRKNEALDSFRTELEDMRVQGDSVPAIIERIAAAEELPEDVKQESLRRIGAL